jgi:integrase
MAVEKRITKNVVDALKPGETVWDSKHSGFGVRCQKRAKTFVFKTRIGGQQRWFSIGRYGAPYTVERAIQRMQIIQGDIAKDLDPAAIRDEKMRNPTLAQAGKAWLETEISKRRLNTRESYSDYMERLAYPTLGKVKVEAVKYSDVAGLHHALRDRPSAANRVVAVLSSFFGWCENHGYRQRGTNPAIGISRNKENKRERFLSARELARVGIALARAERKRTETPFALAAIRLLMLTGCRRDEILTLQWAHVSIEKSMLLLPETKTGARPVYLSAPALEVLSKIPRIAKNTYVICGEREGKHLVNLRKTWVRVCKVARLKGVRIHDLRHSFASVGAQGGVPLQIVGKLLGHAKIQTTERYSHLAADPVKAANEAMGNQIAAMLQGRKSEVVSLKTRVGG